jgi:glycolate oxidase FAD binding subunit
MKAGAGTRLSEVEALLAGENQQFAFEPPDLSRLLGSAHAGTLGGMVAANFAGPRRIKAGAVRDHLLGFTAVSGRGETFKSGSRVMKNVTGYDLSKLMAGSWGTLAVLADTTFKVLPAPETEATVVVAGLAEDAAAQAMSAAMQSAADVSGAAYLARRHGRGLASLARGQRLRDASAHRRRRPVGGVPRRAAARNPQCLRKP